MKLLLYFECATPQRCSAKLEQSIIFFCITEAHAFYIEGITLHSGTEQFRSSVAPEHIKT
jgi:hypothetical protein